MKPRKLRQINFFTSSRRNVTVTIIHLSIAFSHAVIVPSGRCEKIDFAEIWLDAKCMPMAQRSIIGHPGASFLGGEFTPHF
jgi:hypothetical protein